MFESVYWYFNIELTFNDIIIDLIFGPCDWQSAKADCPIFVVECNPES